MRTSKSSHRLNFLITAGGTREYIDPVRFISNASSGRMGYELAWAAAEAGHKATLITGPSSLAAPVGVRVIDVETSAEMFAAVRENFDSCDCLIMAAAVSDYTPVRTAKSKIKKSSKMITLKLKPTPDILKWAGENKKVKSKKEKGKKKIIVGFALEDKNIRANAERKMRDKNLDMIVANTPKAISRLKASVEIKTRKGRWISVRRTGKRVIAGRIIRMIEQVMQAD